MKWQARNAFTGKILTIKVDVPRQGSIKAQSEKAEKLLQQQNNLSDNSFADYIVSPVKD